MYLGTTNKQSGISDATRGSVVRIAHHVRDFFSEAGQDWTPVAPIGVITGKDL